MKSSVSAPGLHRSVEPEVDVHASWTQFRPDVEGLRAIAVALVVLYHAHVPKITAGYVGVDVFFVVSGFVITRLLLREVMQTGTISIVNFYARRARRILPAASLCTIATVFATYKFLGVFAGPLAAEDGKWTAFFAANLHFADLGTSYLASQQPPSPLQHMWSLGVEEQFYFVWPLLIILVTWRASRRSILWRCGGALSAIIVASYAYSIYVTPLNGAVAFFSPLTRAFELGLGALVAVVAPQLTRLPGRFSTWLGGLALLAVVASAFILNDETSWPGSVVLWPTGATALVLVAGGIRQGFLAEKILGSPPMRWLGSRSYSLYLWHWPILTLAAEHAGKPILPAGEVTLLVGAAIVLAEISYRVVENPVRSSALLRRHPRQSVGLGLALTLITFGLMQIWLSQA